MGMMPPCVETAFPFSSGLPPPCQDLKFDAYNRKQGTGIGCGPFASAVRMLMEYAQRAYYMKLPIQFVHALNIHCRFSGMTTSILLVGQRDVAKLM